MKDFDLGSFLTWVVLIIIVIVVFKVVDALDKPPSPHNPIKGLMEFEQGAVSKEGQRANSSQSVDPNTPTIGDEDDGSPGGSGPSPGGPPSKPPTPGPGPGP